MPTNATIFPGQGAQLVGMGKDVAEQYAVAAETFAEADAVLGFAISELCYNGPAEQLNATDIQQPAIFTTAVALFRAAADVGLLKADAIAAMGGLSLGEYTALHLANSMDFAAALRLVQRRGQLMQEAAEAQPGGMVSLMGLDEAKALDLCERVRDRGRLGLANFNCPGQIVASGDKAACAAAAALVEDFGGRAIPLPVAGAFHSELMRPAAEGLREVLANTEIRPPACKVIANVNAEYHDQPETIRESLYQQVFNPVRWQGCVERLMTDGCDLFWEVGPNRVLTGLMRKIDRKTKTINISTVESIEAAKE